MAENHAGRIRAELDALQARAIGRITLRFHQAVTLANPVLTGFSRAGWIPSTGAPKPGPSHPPADRGAASSQASALFSSNSQKAVALDGSYSIKTGSVFIVNAVHYIRSLNMGSSAQAPEMFVETALADALVAARRELFS